jgi:alpha-tubulin suppressor-like RCC1 family protein
VLALNRQTFALMQRIIAISQTPLALMEDGTLWGKGRNDMGQLGTGDTQVRYSWTKVLTSVQVVAASHWNSLAIRKDGTLWAVGSNYKGAPGLTHEIKKLY